MPSVMTREKGGVSRGGPLFRGVATRKDWLFLTQAPRKPGAPRSAGRVQISLASSAAAGTSDSCGLRADLQWCLAESGGTGPEIW